MKRLGAIGLLSCLIWSVAVGQDVRPGEPAGDKDNPHVWKPQVRRVAVFKNGLGFFMRDGEVQLREGWCVSREIPPATFGTLAIYAHAADQVVDLVGAGPGEKVEFDDVDAPADIETKRTRLAACVGLNLQLTYRKGNGSATASGTLRGVETKYVVLENQTDHFAVRLDDVTALQVLELPVRVHVAAEGDKTPARAKLGMAYLRQGITWIPEYTLKIIDGETAELILRGTLVNEAEDLIHCDVSFVVGVPHFVHTAYLEPIAIGQVIRTIGAAVAPQEVMSQIANRAALVRNEASRAMEVLERPVEAPRDVRGMLGSLPQIESASGTDFTVYVKKDLTVRRGERAIVTLFRKTIKYSHIYRWSPPERIAHYLTLHNATDSAWTTGPCLLLDGDRPLGEDLLKYVPRNASGEIPVTEAVNIAHDRSEAEIKRQMKAYSPSSNVFFDLVTLRGELRIRNLENKPVTILIDAPTTGRPLEASDDGVVAIDPDKLRLLERTGRVKWKIELKAAESKTVTYVYERYVPSN